MLRSHAIYQRVATIAVLGVLLVPPVTAQAGESYFLLMFGSQRVPANPNYSHSFATFVRVSWPEAHPCNPLLIQVESFTISWLPANLRVRTLALCAESGVNLDLHSTLKYVLANDERVSLWGPYQIEPQVYDWAAQQRGRLESGQVRYKADDIGRNTAYVTNCIHAISNVITGPRLRVMSPGWGETASYAILRRFMPYVLDCDATHTWLIYYLGIQCYPIIYRDRQAPKSGGLIGPINHLLGGERNLQPSYGPPR